MPDDVVTVRTGTVTLTIHPDRVRIEKHGLGGLWQGGAWKGAREIAFSQITGLEWRDAGRFKEGYLQFLHAAGGHGRDAYHDENAVIFARRNQPQFEAAKAEIDRRIQAARAGGPGPAQPDVADQLRKLGALRDAGVLTEEEFAAKKADMLARM